MSAARDVASEGDRRERLTRTQKAIAKLTLRSHMEIPTFYVRVRARVDALLEGLAEHRNRHTRRVTINDASTRAMVLALADHPRLNATFDSEHEEIVLHEQVNLGVVVATNTGLMIPTIPDAARLGVVEIAEHVAMIREQVAGGTLKGTYLSPPTATLSNLGMFGVEEFTAIIPGRGVAVLALGAVMDLPIVDEGRVVPARTMTLTLTVDHRGVNGKEAALFVADVKRILEEPPAGFWD
jgi:pyruvate dehydrogenase E2 component (dihydrolipoamide acetyltransferase)